MPTMEQLIKPVLLTTVLLLITPFRSVHSQDSTAYCEPNQNVPQLQNLPCVLCKDRCGSITGYTQDRLCSCDPGCIAYGDCCSDFEQSCPAQFSASKKLRENFKTIQTECLFLSTLRDSEAEIEGFLTDFRSVYAINQDIVTICGSTGKQCEKAHPDKLLEPNLAIPVVDPEFTVHYINYECAKCNNVQNVVLWTPQVACFSSNTALFAANETFNIDSKEKLKHYLKTCVVHYVVPELYPIREYCIRDEYKRTCPSGCRNTKLTKLCNDSYISGFVKGDDQRSETYFNHYCALCNGERLEDISCGPIALVKAPGSEGPGAFSLSLLFDFNTREGVTVGRKGCEEGQEWIDSLQGCHQVSCPVGWRLVEGECQPGTLDTEITAAIYFNFSKDISTVQSALETQDKTLTAALKMKFLSLLGNKDMVRLKLISEQIEANQLNVSLEVQLTFDNNSTFNFKTHTHNFSREAIAFFKDELVLLVFKSDIDLGNVIISVSDDLTFKQDQLSDCTWFEITEDKFNINNESLVIQSTGAIYQKGHYQLIQAAALVCIPTNQLTDVKLKVSYALGILTIILISLSILCLLIRLALQFKVSYYQTFAGWLHFNLCLSLCLAFLVLLLGGIIAQFDSKGMCTTFGILMYYFFMAAFFWMTAVTVDTWLVFRPSARYMAADDSEKSLSRYTIPCWIIPAVIAAIVTGLDYTNIDPRFQPQFGAAICWFNQRYALLCYFGAPLAFLILTTTILFIITVMNIRKTVQATVKVKNSKTSHQVMIYVRLLMLFGVSWIFGFLAAFVGHDALWIIFIILNASQGFLIFVSFVLRQPVLKEVKLWISSSFITQDTTDSSGVRSFSTSETSINDSQSRTNVQGSSPI